MGMRITRTAKSAAMIPASCGQSRTPRPTHISGRTSATELTGVSVVTARVLANGLRRLRLARHSARLRSAARAGVGARFRRPPPQWGLPDTFDGVWDRTDWPGVLHARFAAKFRAPDVAAEGRRLKEQLLSS